jgi:energy-coupling factor transport system substrate-specific component
MDVSTSSPASTPETASVSRTLRWRVVDIVVASVIGVASGLIFLVWNIAYVGPNALLAPLLPGLQGLLDGPWLFAGVLGALIIRKPGAALYTEVIAAAVSAITLIGNTWGAFLTFEAGLVQGIGAELIFLLFRYRRWSLPVAALAGMGAAIAGGINNMLLWYVGADVRFMVVYFISTSISGAVIAGGLSWLLARGLAKTGALDRFASGREARTRV